MEPLDMTLEEALDRNQFLQKALDEAIKLAVIRTWNSGYIVAGYGNNPIICEIREPLSCFPSLVEYLEEKEK